MSVEDLNSIDAIGIDSNSGMVVLTISDHLEWDDNKRLLMLQEKINTYLSFIESGEIYEAYKEAKNKPIGINVIFKHSPNEDGLHFLNAISNIVKSANINFNHQLFDS